MYKEIEVIKTEHIVAQSTIVKCAGEISFEEWQEFGLKAIGAEKFVQWYLGAWWNFGHKKWSRDAEEFIKKIGYKRSTLALYGSVYNSVKPLIRIKGLTFRHHQTVAPLEEPEQ